MYIQKNKNQLNLHIRRAPKTDLMAILSLISSNHFLHSYPLL